jgi:hypothetical protein
VYQYLAKEEGGIDIRVLWLDLPAALLQGGMVLQLFCFLFFLLHATSCIILEYNLTSNQPPLAYVPSCLSLP